MEREPYYINLQSTEISQAHSGTPNGLKIYARPSEISNLRGMFDKLHAADLMSYFRAHVPIVSYHRDGSNDRHDRALTEAMQLIAELGDDQTKAFMDEVGTLNERPE